MYFATHFPEDSSNGVSNRGRKNKKRLNIETRTKLEEIHNNIEEFYNIQETFIFYREVVLVTLDTSFILTTNQIEKKRIH